MRKKLNSKGFTLIELLIVIIIIGILAAVAFVAYGSSTKKAKKADAESTVASVKAKLGEYSAENGNYPTTKAAVVTYLQDVANSEELATKFNAAGYAYTATDSSGAACDNATTQCTDFDVTASGATLGFDGDVTASN